ncbi:zinc-binding dehydrogenase [Thioalkalivibrio sp. ALE19]|uniref:quinone oxidoreductase family protein n=1 Tax=Thioalkalivibrio sp. ALE19 TaxID=1266909 RepID=UPI0003F948B8|nr:zinc-binding dehydrogenase [Thioalkalivibrio sp. ALE19]
MQAIQFNEPGSADVLYLGECPDPVIREPDEVRVRLLAAGVNPVDTKVRAGGMLVEGAPHNTPGCDGVGIVEACGDAVQHVRPGQRVAFCFGGTGADPGTCAEQAVVPEAALVPVPDAVSDAEAAALPLAWITAREALIDRGGLQKGDYVLVHAASGGVGQMAVQLARAANARVLGLVRSDAGVEVMRALGADHVDIRSDRAATDIAAFTDGRYFDLVLDTVGGDTFVEGLGQIRFAGRLVTLLAPPDGMDWNPARLQNAAIHLELMLTPMLQRSRTGLARQAKIVADGLTRLEAGTLEVNVEDVLPLAQTAEAHRRIEAGGRRGKLVLRIPD